MLKRHFNSENDEVNNLKAISKYLFILLKSLRKLPRYNKGILYRGIKSNDIFKDKNRKPYYIQKFFVSFSIKKILLYYFIVNKEIYSYLKKEFWDIV